jgi:hypothetical protein
MKLHDRSNYHSTITSHINRTGQLQYIIKQIQFRQACFAQQLVLAPSHFMYYRYWHEKMNDNSSNNNLKCTMNAPVSLPFSTLLVKLKINGVLVNNPNKDRLRDGHV